MIDQLRHLHSVYKLCYLLDVARSVAIKRGVLTK